MEKLAEIDLKHIPKGFTGIAIFLNGNKHWYKEGKRHRLDGPAVEYADGGKLWFKEGKLHREDEPAVELTNGRKEWWLDGKYHRLDGPAIETENGQKFWYIEGKPFQKEKLFNLTKQTFLGKEKGKYGLEWLKFSADTGTEEFPIIPGLDIQILMSINSYLKLNFAGEQRNESK